MITFLIPLLLLVVFVTGAELVHVGQRANSNAHHFQDARSNSNLFTISNVTIPEEHSQLKIRGWTRAEGEHA